MHCDSQSALLLAQNSIYRVRIKHIDIRYHRIRELIRDGEMKLVKVHTKENPADILTKVLPWDNFHYCVTLMGLVDRTKFIKTWKHQDGDCKLRCDASKP